MADNIDDIKEYYETGEEEVSRLERFQLKREMTLRYFTEYLPSEGRILEIGSSFLTAHENVIEQIRHKLFYKADIF